MLNFIPKKAASVSLLYGKRPVQRIVVGTSARTVEIPTELIDSLHAEVDTTTDYARGTYNALPFRKFAEVQLDAAALMKTEKTTAISNVDWFPQINAVHAANVAAVQTEAVSKLATATSAKFPISH